MGIVKNLIYGLAVGDALGVPVEFKERFLFKKKPVTTMLGQGTYNQPIGTWSDDTSLALCIMDGIEEKINYTKIVKNFIDWKNKAKFTASGNRFDIGNTTWEAITNHEKFPENVFNNGVKESKSNGSLMRCSTLVFFVKDLPFLQRIEIITKTNALTHGNIETLVCDIFLIEFILELIENHDKELSLANTINSLIEYFSCKEQFIEEFDVIEFLDGLQSLSSLPEKMINSTGYCIDTLEAALWCFMSSFTYKESVLKAVNLGNDTDTIAAITGAISGSYYGFQAIPEEWIEVLVNKELIDEISLKLEKEIE